LIETEFGQLTRIVAWNINARTNPVDLKQYIESPLFAMRPDIFILTEYVASEREHERFASVLANAGFVWTVTPPPTASVRKNRVLIASKFTLSEPIAPVANSIRSASANYLHVRLSSLNFDLVGLRIPWYESHHKEEKRRYPEWLISQLSPMVDRRVLVVGDFNFDPAARLQQKWIQEPIREKLMASSDRSDVEARWLFYTPDDESPSFYTGSRLDHAMRTKRMPGPVSIRYASRVASNAIMTSRIPSDHAALVMDFDFEAELERRESSIQSGAPKPMLV